MRREALPRNIPPAELEQASAPTLVRAARMFGAVVLGLGLLWIGLGLIVAQPTLVLLGLLSAVFGGLLVIEARRSRNQDASGLATRLAVATLLTAVAAVFIEPIIGTPLAVGSLIPVVLALPYVRRRTLTWLMAGASVVAIVALVAPVVLPWGQGSSEPLAEYLPISTVVTVFVLFLILLRNASRLLSDAASELRAVVAMSRDLAATLDPRDVGNRLARHIALATGAADCAISTWDRDADRVVTFGYFPTEEVDNLEPTFELSRFPATRAVLLSQQPQVIDVDDPAADQAEVEYLRANGQRSLVMLPLVARGESIGIVELASAQPRAFGQRQLELAQLLVRDAAVTFDNARLHESLRQLAFRDSLTGLANRAKFHERVDHALARLNGRSPLRVAVLYIDLDQFKHVNDRFGHAVGDRVLQLIAERIRSAIRPGDTAARLGGDEFAVLLEDIDGLEAANVVSARLLEQLTRPVELDAAVPDAAVPDAAVPDAAPVVGGSIGIAVSGPDAATTDLLLRNADVAMYAAKAAGRGQTLDYQPDLQELAYARPVPTLELERYLRRGRRRAQPTATQGEPSPESDANAVRLN